VAIRYWVGIALHLWPFVSDNIALFVLKRDVKLQLTNLEICHVARATCCTDGVKYGMEYARMVRTSTVTMPSFMGLGLRTPTGVEKVWRFLFVFTNSIARSVAPVFWLLGTILRFLALQGRLSALMGVKSGVEEPTRPPCQNSPVAVHGWEREAAGCKN